MKANAKKTLFYLFIVFVGFVFIIPLIYLTSTSVISRIEVNDFPKPMLPRLTHTVEFDYNEERGWYEISRENFAGEMIPLNFGDSERLNDYLQSYFNVFMTEEELQEIMQPAEDNGEIVKVKLRKDLTANYEKFFEIFDNADDAFVNSVKAAVITIVLALSIGGSLGYALARTSIKGKDAIGIGALVVRMFPTIAISVSAAVMLQNFGLYNSMFGLAVVYAIPNIGLTAWITRGIFMGVNKELEEASLVFGANKWQTFYRITLPLVLPAFAASSMYAFITAWNDTGVAMLLTDSSNPTFALVLYSAMGGNESLTYAASGSILLIAPALIFTFFLRKYINQLWG